MSHAPGEEQLLAALLRTADRLHLPLTHRQVNALAEAAAQELPAPVPAAPRPAPPPPRPTLEAPVGPTSAQLNNLIAKTRCRALSPLEANRLAAGVDALRELAGDLPAPRRRHPLEVRCPVCGAVVGRGCRTAVGARTKPHRARLWGGV